MAKTKENSTKEEPIEKQLWKAADKLRKNIDAAEYKHIVLGLIFLKYISDAFEDLHTRLKSGKGEYAGADPEDKDEYKAENVFFVPEIARWSYLQSKAKLPTIGKEVDNAMDAIEKDNPSLKDVLPKVFARGNLDPTSLGGLIDLIANIALGDAKARSADLLGHVFEYFLGEFALAEGKKGGQFYTPRSVVELLVEMLEPHKGRVFDPCCGSGGMFVQSEKFVANHRGKVNDISIYGQESNLTTWRLAKMNLAIRSIDSSQVKWNNEGSFLNDVHKDLKTDFVIANPHFNDSDWSGDLLRKDGRWKYGVPPAGNANYAWIQHFLYHLSPSGIAGFVLAKGSLTTDTSGEGEIRRELVESYLVDCIVNLPSKLFLNTQIPACLWFLRRNKENGKYRNRKNEILFIDARNMGSLINRRTRQLSHNDIKTIADTYHKWRNKDDSYEDIKGFCCSTTIERIREFDYLLSPGRYVGLPDDDEDQISIEEKVQSINKALTDYSSLSTELDLIIGNALSEHFSSKHWKHLPFPSSELLEYLADSIFNSWLIDNENSDLEKIPLDRIANYLNGIACQKYPLKKGESGLPVLKIKELRNGFSENSDWATSKVPQEYVVRNGDVIFSWSGSLLVKIWDGEDCVLNQHLFKVTSEKYPKWFYYLWTKYHLNKFIAIAESKATTMGHIKRDDLSTSMVILPLRDDFKTLDSLMTPIFDKIILINQLALKVKNIKIMAKM